MDEIISENLIGAYDEYKIPISRKSHKRLLLMVGSHDLDVPEVKYKMLAGHDIKSKSKGKGKGKAARK